MGKGRKRQVEDVTGSRSLNPEYRWLSSSPLYSVGGRQRASSQAAEQKQNQIISQVEGNKGNPYRRTTRV